TVGARAEGSEWIAVPGGAEEHAGAIGAEARAHELAVAVGELAEAEGARAPIGRIEGATPPPAQQEAERARAGERGGRGDPQEGAARAHRDRRLVRGGERGWRA